MSLYNNAPWYCVREDVKTALDFKETARADAAIDRGINAAARAIDGRLHRVFYPILDTRSFDWPNIQTARPWRLWLGQNEMAAAPTAVSSGGVGIATNTVIPYPNWGPPFTRLELDVSTSSAWSAATTWQNSITLTGLYGYRADEIPAGVLAAGITSTATTFNPGVPGYRGVGSILRIGTERMIVTGRSSVTTGQTLQSDMAAKNGTNLVAVTDATQFVVGESILIDAERMLILDAPGSNLLVNRAWDGTTLATHTTGATIYANRQLTVTRGALGTTAAAHSTSSAIAEHDPPALIRELNIALAIVDLLQERAGYPMPMGGHSPPGQKDTRPSTDFGNLDDLWDRAIITHGRIARVRTA